MMVRIRIEQPPDHALVLRVTLLRLTFEEFDTSLAQHNGHLDTFTRKNQFLWPGRKVRNDSEVS